MKKICFVTGTRADFGKLKSLLAKLSRESDFEEHIFATGMHTLARYGTTYEEIKRAGFNNVFLYINQMTQSSSAMDIVLANTIQGIGHYLREFTADMIVVHGDRVEALAGAIVGALNNTLVAHIEGGELSGTIDEVIRHAVSKLSHLHFVANEEAKRRLIQMGEKDQSIFVIGSPDIDVMLSDQLPDISEVRKRYEIDYKEYGIFIYHPVTTDIAQLRNKITTVMDALNATGWNYVVINPNNDFGSDIILEEYSKLSGNKRFCFFPSMRFEYFLTLLKNAKAIIGNSSTGIREAPVYGVPTINIGTRQTNRFNYPSIINISEDKEDIIKIISNLPSGLHTPTFHFGNGRSAENFISCLRMPELWQTPCQKQFQDL